ncbi:MAG: hypothetical protein Kow00121_10550 [Elainellaceae cyanobacterium]
MRHQNPKQTARQKQQTHSSLSLIRLYGILAFASPLMVGISLTAFSEAAQTQITEAGSAEADAFQASEAERLLNKAWQLWQMGQYQAVLENLQQSLIIYQNLQDWQGESTALNGLGTVYNDLGHHEQALNHYQQVLAIYVEVGDRAGEGHTLNNIGIVYRNLGQYEQALNSYQQALIIYVELGDRVGEGQILNSIGGVYRQMAQYAQALNYHQQALTIRIELGDRVGEGQTFNSIGGVYSQMAQYAQALNYYQQALVIATEVGDRVGEATTLNNMGGVYDDLGQYEQALDYYQQALAISTEVGDRAGRGVTLTGIGLVYDHLGEYEQALNHYQQSLAIATEVGDQVGKATTLNNMGGVYDDLEQYGQALDYYQQALSINISIGNRLGEGYTLNNIGGVHNRLEQYAEALEYFQQALAIRQEIGDRSGVAQTLSWIGYQLQQQAQTEIAIVFYKESVNVQESIRKELGGLQTEFQESYIQTVEATYRELADLLLQQDRILEAQQVLDLLKVQELDDYLRGIRGNEQTAQGVDLLPQEQAILDDYMTLLDRAIPIGQELTQLRQTPPENRTEAQVQRIAELVEQQQAITRLFVEFIRRPDVVAWAEQLSRTAREQNLDLSTLRNLSGTLQDLQTQLNQNVVLFYPLILEDRLELVLVTPDSPPINRTSPISRTELNAAIEEFRRALEDPSTDATAVAQQLYQWLIQPIQADLDRANAEVIIYAPDAQLRYIPLAALHDGTQWLTQRYLINHITAASLTNFARPSQESDQVLAGAFVEGSYTVQVGDRSYTFDGLDFADDEVEYLTSLFPMATKLVDRDFSAATTLPSLDDHNIVHFATHAAFFPGRAASDSFILFGNGDRVSLQQVEEEWFLTNVDLIVLSACQTGLGGTYGGGEEILGFGYLMQNAGARAAIATLWEVSDGGTQALMTAFYAALQQDGITKAEALHRSQTALITGNYEALEDETRGIVELRQRIQESVPTVAPHLDHPYYWAPFILIGNGL